MAPAPIKTYFSRGTDGKWGCNKCGRVYGKASSNSTLYYHIEHSHHIFLRKNPPKRSSSQLSSSQNSSETEDDPQEVHESNAESSGASVAPSDAPSGASAAPSGASAAPSAAGDSGWSREGPLDKFMLRAAAFARGGERDVAVTEALVYLIVKMDLPLLTPEHPAFRLFMARAQPLYKVPCEQTTTLRMNSKYEDMKAKVGAKIAAAKAVCLAVDLWTHKHTMQGYLGMTCTWREGKKLVTIEIGCRPMPERKTSANLRLAMRELCAEWQIKYDNVRGVVSDGGANIKAAVRAEFGADKHIDCFAHKVNGIGQTVLGISQHPAPADPARRGAPAAPARQGAIDPDEEFQFPNVVELPDDEDEAEAILDDPEEQADPSDCLRALLLKVKATVRFFRSSEVATTELKNLQEEQGKAPLKLIQEVKTRWNSAYYMVDRYLALSEFVNRVVFKMQREKCTRSKPPAVLTLDEIDALVEVRELLKPLEEATRMVSKDKEPTISDCIPIVFGLKVGTAEYMPTTGIGFNLKEALLKEIQLKFSGLELLRPYAAATLLDPRYKKCVFERPTAVGLIVSHLSKQINEKLVATGRALEESAAASSTQPESSIWTAVDSALRQNACIAVDEDRTRNIPAQLTAYLASPPISRAKNRNVLVTWQGMRCGLEYVYELALEFLIVLATSTSAERLFSHAGHIVTQIRSRLSPQHLNRLIFLRSVPQEWWFE